MSRKHSRRGLESRAQNKDENVLLNAAPTVTAARTGRHSDLGFITLAWELPQNLTTLQLHYENTFYNPNCPSCDCRRGGGRTHGRSHDPSACRPKAVFLQASSSNGSPSFSLRCGRLNHRQIRL